MALICVTVTSWVQQSVLQPVNTWTTTQQQQCQKLPWWNPLGWLCWLVTFVILVVVWVTNWIVVPLTSIVCTTITAVLYLFALPFVAAFQKPRDWLAHWFYTPLHRQITHVSTVPSTLIGYFDYTFTCYCGKTVTVTAQYDDVAAELARWKCSRVC